jgi:hypothetical protein
VKKLIHTFLSLVIVATLTISPLTLARSVRAEDAPPAPTESSQQSTPEPTAAPNNNNDQNTQSTPSPTANPAVATPAAPKTPAPAKTPVPKSDSSSTVTPKPAATPQTPQQAATSQSQAQSAQSASTPQATVNPQGTTSTGAQSGDRKTGDTTVKTGDANVNGAIVNSVNNNVASSGGGNGSGSGNVATSNNGNGDSSNNNATGNSTTSSDQALQNSADVDNGVHVGAVTGVNTASRNTGSGTIESGDANVGITVINSANNNISGLAVNQYDVNGNQSGDIVIGASSPTASCGGSSGACHNGVVGSSSANNSGNGTQSANNANSNNNASSAAYLSNDADVVNDVAVDAVTGQNTANSNVGSGNIKSGDANVAVTVLNFLNNNIIAGTIDVVNILGNYDGNIVLPTGGSEVASGPAGNNAAGNHASGNSVSNKNNGDSSTNSANANSNSVDTTNQANAADIDNNINVNANTGLNSASSNTNNGNNVKTGSTNVNAQVYNVANVNSKDGGYIVLVNDHGQWHGTIYGASGSQSGSEGVNFTVNPDGTVVASNNGNGTESNNTAQANSNSNTTTTQTNSAKLQNNVNINADTGHNTASRNTGGGNIETGNVNVVASVMNFVNNNFVGKSFKVLLVNVLGKWNGNVVAPGQSTANNKPAQGGVQQSSKAAAAPSPSTTAGVQTTPMPSTNASPAAQTVANGTVLGKMKLSKGSVLGAFTKESAEIQLKDGKKYYVDNTLDVPQNKPIVAAAVSTKKTAPSWNWIIVSAFGTILGGVALYKKFKKSV